MVASIGAMDDGAAAVGTQPTSPNPTGWRLSPKKKWWRLSHVLLWVGLVLFIAGLIAPFVTRSIVKNAISDRRVLSSAGFWKKGGCDGGPLPASVTSDLCRSSETTRDYLLFNITNALAMIHDAAKPELTEIHVAVDCVRTMYDANFDKDDDGKEIVRFSVWEHCTPAAGFDDVLESEMVQLNIPYVAGVATTTGSETLAFLSRSSTAVEAAADIFNTTLPLLASQYCTLHAMYSLFCGLHGAYCEFGDLEAYCAYTTSEQSAALFGNRTKMMQLLVDTNDTHYPSLGADSLLFSDWFYNGVASINPAAADAIVVEPELGTYSAMGNAGCSAVATFNEYYWNSAYLPSAFAEYNSETGCDIELTPGQSQHFFRHLADSDFSAQFMQAVYYYVNAMQTSGLLTNKNMLVYNDFSGAGSLYDTLTDSRCTNAGINYGNAFTVFKFIGNYLPEQLILRGSVVGYYRDRDTGVLSLNADGTGFLNGGVVTRQTVKKFLFGYNDTLATRNLGRPSGFPGVTGKMYPSISEELRFKPKQQQALYTGKGDSSVWSQWHSNENGSTATLHRSDLGARFSVVENAWVSFSCDPLPWNTANYGEDDCKIWNRTENLQGEWTGMGFKPMFELNQAEHVYSPAVRRQLQYHRVSSDHKFDKMPGVLVHTTDYAEYNVRGIKTVRYRLAPDAFANTTASAADYFIGKSCKGQEWCSPSGMLPMDRLAGFPLTMSFPRLCYSDEEDTVSITKHPDFKDISCSQLRSQIAVDPLSGINLEAKSTSQSNTVLSNTVLDGSLFSGFRNWQLVPFFAQISTVRCTEAQAKKLGKVFTMIDSAAQKSYICVGLGVLCIAWSTWSWHNERIAKIRKVAVYEGDPAVGSR